MLRSLKDWIWPSGKKTKNFEEVIIPVFLSQNISNKSPMAINKHTRKYEYITFKSAVENLSKSSELHLNEKKFLDKSDKETQLYIDKIQKEISKQMPLSVLKDIKIRGRKDKSFTAWLLLQENSEPFKIDESFLENVPCYPNPKVTAVTLLNSEEERGLRISLNENKCRLYEVVNGSCKIQFNWKVGNKNCSIAVNISSEGTLACDNISEDLTFGDLEENKEVKIRIGGVKNKQMTLAELICPDKLLRSSSGEVKILTYGNSKIENLLKKSTEVKDVFETFESQLPQGISKEVKVFSEGANKVEEFVATSPEAKSVLNESGSYK